MKRLLLGSVLLLAGIGLAAAQTAAPVVPGYYSTTGCTGASPCFLPYTSTNPLPTTATGSAVTVTALDIASVTTGGVAVNALSAGHATHGGFVLTANAAGICVNARGAAGTATSGDTVCVVQNQAYTIPPTATAISVNSTASTVTLAGNGFD